MVMDFYSRDKRPSIMFRIAYEKACLMLKQENGGTHKRTK